MDIHKQNGAIISLAGILAMCLLAGCATRSMMNSPPTVTVADGVVMPSIQKRGNPIPKAVAPPQSLWVHWDHPLQGTPGISFNIYTNGNPYRPFSFWTNVAQSPVQIAHRWRPAMFIAVRTWNNFVESE